MVRFECDNCAVLKKSNEEWILGFAADSMGVKTARREIAIAPVWDREDAVRTLAVHFCSDECRAEYTEKLFAHTPTTQSGAETVAVKHMERVTPGAVVETVIAEPPKRVTRRTFRKAS